MRNESGVLPSQKRFNPFLKDNCVDNQFQDSSHEENKQQLSDMDADKITIDELGTREDVKDTDNHIQSFVVNDSSNIDVI